MRCRVLLLAVIAVAVVAPGVRGYANFVINVPTVIDFESFGSPAAPLPEGTLLPAVSINGVTVSFAVESANGTFAPAIAAVGSPRVAFVSGVVGDDTPATSAGEVYTAGGEYSLTDGITKTRDYLISFSEPVANLSLDLYDFRGDGPEAVGPITGLDTVTFEVYDAVGSIIGSDAYTASSPRPVDGNVVNLAVGVWGIHSARLHFATVEGGTAIDNVTFMIPEPGSLGLAGWGVLGVACLMRRSRRKRM